MIQLAVAGIMGRMGTAVAQLAARDQRFKVVVGLAEPGDARIGDTLPFGGAEIPIRDHLTAAAPSKGPPVRPCDVLIDFTVADGTMAWLSNCERLQIPMVIGATGHTPQQLERVQAAAHLIPIVKATNFSSGVQVIINALRRTVMELGDDYDIEIIETHHRHKVDAPSGTALSILDAIRSAQHTLPSRDRQRAVEALGAGESNDAGAGTVFGRQGRVGERKKGEIGVHAVRMGEHVGQHEIHLSSASETITLRHTAHSREAFAAGALRAAAWIVARPPGYYTMADVLA